MTEGALAPDPRDLRLSSRSVVTALLAKHGLRADKRFGQNFLVDRSALDAIVDAAAILPGDHVLEVGTGLGVLTLALAERAGHVVTLELDERLFPVLATTLHGVDNVTLVHADALRFDLASLPARGLLVANLPYNVGTAVVGRALESGRFRRLVFLAQLEVAERLKATAGDEGYGALSLLVAHFGAVSVVRSVAAAAFLPPPKVTSAIVRIDVREGVEPDDALFALIHTSFAHRRKTLVSNLRYAGHDPGDVRRMLTELGFDPRVRAEELGLEDFRRLLVSIMTSSNDNGRDAIGILP